MSSLITIATKVEIGGDIVDKLNSGNEGEINSFVDNLKNAQVSLTDFLKSFRGLNQNANKLIAEAIQTKLTGANGLLDQASFLEDDRKIVEDYTNALEALGNDSSIQSIKLTIAKKIQTKLTGANGLLNQAPFSEDQRKIVEDYTNALKALGNDLSIQSIKLTIAQKIQTILTDAGLWDPNISNQKLIDSFTDFAIMIGDENFSDVRTALETQSAGDNSQKLTTFKDKYSKLLTESVNQKIDNLASGSNKLKMLDQLKSDIETIVDNEGVVLEETIKEYSQGIVELKLNKTVNDNKMFMYQETLCNAIESNSNIALDMDLLDALGHHAEAATIHQKHKLFAQEDAQHQLNQKLRAAFDQSNIEFFKDPTDDALTTLLINFNAIKDGGEQKELMKKELEFKINVFLKTVSFDPKIKHGPSTVYLKAIKTFDNINSELKEKLVLANAGLGLIAEMPTDDEESSDLVAIKDELKTLNQSDSEFDALKTSISNKVNAFGKKLLSEVGTNEFGLSKKIDALLKFDTIDSELKQKLELANAGLGLIAAMPTDDQKRPDLVAIKDELKKLNQPGSNIDALKTSIRDKVKDFSEVLLSKVSTGEDGLSKKIDALLKFDTIDPQLKQKLELANAGLGLIAAMPTDDQERPDLVAIKDELKTLNQSDSDIGALKTSISAKVNAFGEKLVEKLAVKDSKENPKDIQDARELLKFSKSLTLSEQLKSKLEYRMLRMGSDPVGIDEIKVKGDQKRQEELQKIQDNVEGKLDECLKTAVQFTHRPIPKDGTNNEKCIANITALVKMPSSALQHALLNQEIDRIDLGELTSDQNTKIDNLLNSFNESTYSGIEAPKNKFDAKNKLKSQGDLKTLLDSRNIVSIVAPRPGTPRAVNTAAVTTSFDQRSAPEQRAIVRSILDNATADKAKTYSKSIRGSNLEETFRNVKNEIKKDILTRMDRLIESTDYSNQHDQLTKIQKELKLLNPEQDDSDLNKYLDTINALIEANQKKAQFILEASSHVTNSMTARFEDASKIQKSLQDWLSDKQRGGTLIKELQNKLNEAVTHLKLTDDKQRPYHKKILQMKDRFNSHTTDTSRSNLTTSSRDVDPITRFAFGTVLLVGSPIYRMCNGFFGKSKEFTRDARNIKAEVDLLRYERSFF